MVLTEYSEKKKKEGKDSIETIMSLIEFPLLDQTSSNPLFQLHQTIFQIGQDSQVYGPFYMVPVVVSLNLLH